jgi:outer membrane protein assembly factor BamD (BamD/ComL family)
MAQAQVADAVPASLVEPVIRPTVLARKNAVRRPEASSTVSTDTLREQAARLDHVRALLQAGESNVALASLDEYDRRFAGTPLSEESLLLRIEALARRGDRSAAATLARRFLKAHPASVHADRVTALLRSVSP